MRQRQRQKQEDTERDREREKRERKSKQNISVSERIKRSIGSVRQLQLFIEKQNNLTKNKTKLAFPLNSGLETDSQHFAIQATS